MLRHLRQEVRKVSNNAPTDRYRRAIAAYKQRKEEEEKVAKILKKDKIIPEDFEVRPPKPKKPKKKPKNKTPKKPVKKKGDIGGMRVYKSGKMSKMKPIEELVTFGDGGEQVNVKHFLAGKREIVMDARLLRSLSNLKHGEKVAFDGECSINWNEKKKDFEFRGKQPAPNEFLHGAWMPGHSGMEYARDNPNPPPRMNKEEGFEYAVKLGKKRAVEIYEEREKNKPISKDELEQLTADEINVLKAAAKVEAIIRHAREDKAFFIENFVKIEDKDAPEPVTLFKLWPKQREALEAFDKNKLTIVLKARQLGLSWLALAFATHGLLFQPGYSVVALSKREDEAKELVRRVRLILEYMPPFLIRKKDKNLPDNYSGPTWEATTTYISINHPESKVPSMFTSFTSSPDSARSFTASLVILDEWAFQMYAQEIWAAAYPVINRPTGGKVIGISTARIGSFFQEVWEKAMAGKNNFHPIFLPWYSDPRRTQQWYEDTKAELPLSYLQEYPATPEEAFSAGSATAFPEFDPDVHVIEPFDIPDHWRRWLSVDNGYDHPFAWLWYAVDEDGNVYVYREFSRSRDDPKILYTEQAARVVEMSVAVSLDNKGSLSIGKEHLDFCVAGLDAWNTHHRDTSGKTLIDYYRDGGLQIGFRKAIVDRRLRKAVVHEYLKVIEDEDGTKRSKLKIFNTCKHLISTLPKLPKDNNDPEKVADCAIDNQYDSLSYGLIAYHVDKSIGLESEVPLIRAHKDSVAKRNTRMVRRRVYM